MLFSRARLPLSFPFFFFNDTATTEIYTLSLHDALPISLQRPEATQGVAIVGMNPQRAAQVRGGSLEVAALQLEVPEHRQRERDRRRVSQRATDRVVLAQQPLGPIEIAVVQRQNTMPEQRERQEHAARRVRARQAVGPDEEPLGARTA